MKKHIKITKGLNKIKAKTENIKQRKKIHTLK